MHQPEISIVMPVFNTELFVGQAIESLLMQSFADFELIIVDDGSTDKSPEIISDFDDSRIRILTNKTNQGIVFSRNRGLSEIKGQFYAPFDSDDIAKPEKFEKQIRFLKHNPDFAMVGCWAKLIDESGNVLGEKWKLKAKSEQIPSIMLFRNYFVHSAILVRKEAIPAGLYQEGLDVVEDYKFCTDIAIKHKVYNLPEYLLEYRIRENSAMRTNSERVAKQDKKIYNYLFERLHIQLTITQLNCIFALKQSKAIPNINSLREIQDLLILVLEKNKEFKIYDQKNLEKTLANRWLKACYLAKSNHLKLLREFTSSPLSKLILRS